MQEKSRYIASLWKDYYISMLPSYAFKYDEGEMYVSTGFMVGIEKKIKDIYIKCLENNGEYPLPPPIDKSNGYRYYNN